MNKRYILPIALLTLVSLAFLVSALDGIMTKDENSRYNIEVSVVKGWNIIAGTIPNSAISSDSEIKSQDIKAAWYYSPILKKYLQISPNPDELFHQIDDDDALTSAIWVYSDKAGRLKYNTLEDYAPLDLRKLSAGYNFVTITPDMYSGTLDGAGYDYEYFIWNKIKGNCNLQSIHAWNPETQGWIAVDANMNFGEEINDFIGMGMIVKVSSDCTLGSPSSSGGTNPPGLPTSTEDNPQFRKDIESYYYDEISISSCEDEFEYSGFSLKEDCYQYVRCSAEKFSNLIPEGDLESLREDMRNNGGQKGYINYLNNHNSFYDTFLTEIEVCKDNTK